MSTLAWVRIEEAFGKGKKEIQAVQLHSCTQIQYWFGGCLRSCMLGLNDALVSLNRKKKNVFCNLSSHANPCFYSLLLDWDVLLCKSNLTTKKLQSGFYSPGVREKGPVRECFDSRANWSRSSLPTRRGRTEHCWDPLPFPLWAGRLPMATRWDVHRSEQRVVRD